jgi:hypothetical protein
LMIMVVNTATLAQLMERMRVTMTVLNMVLNASCVYMALNSVKCSKRANLKCIMEDGETCDFCRTPESLVSDIRS